jgi:hypothetical protein
MKARQSTVKRVVLFFSFFRPDLNAVCGLLIDSFVFLPRIRHNYDNESVIALRNDWQDVQRVNAQRGTARWWRRRVKNATAAP